MNFKKIKEYIQGNEFKTAFIIFMVAFITRILLFSKGPFYYDTVDYMISMRDKVISPHQSSYPFVAFLIIALGYFRDFLMPCISYFSLLLFATAFLASVASAVIYIVFSRLFERNMAIVYAAIFSFLPPFFSITTFGRIDYALVFVFLPLSIYCFLKHKIGLCILFSALSISSRPENIFVFLGYFMFILLNSLENKKLLLYRRLYLAIKEFSILFFCSVFLVVLIAVFVPKGEWFSRVILPAIGKKRNTDQLLFLGLNLARSFSGLALIFKTTVLVPALFGVYGFLRRLFANDIKTTLLFFVAFISSFLYLTNLEVLGARYLLFSFFFLFFFTSYAVVDVFKRTGFIIFFTILCVVVMITPVFSVIYHRHMNAYQVDFVRFLDDITEPDSLIVAHDNAVFLKYYSKRNFVIPPTSYNELEWHKFIQKILDAIKNGQSVYVTSTSFSYDPYLIFRKFVTGNFYLQWRGARLNENWHGMETETHLFNESVFKLVPNIPVSRR